MSAVCECDVHRVGTNVLDFIIANRIILEIKSNGMFRKNNYEQVKQYLAASDIPLAILARFGADGVIFQRVLNPKNICRFVENS